ncbi:MAG: hypothetical protein L0Y71_00570 [Gemmataceae bacterium]|nr:hypothetical protein [Gemmataceae bacterium]
MATARMLSPGLSLSASWRHFQAAVGLALAAIAFGGVIYLIETFVLGCRHRFVENPSDVMMRGLGLAHFWIGWLFLFTSPSLRNRTAAGKLALLTILGAAMCVFSWSQGGMKNPFLLIAFYAYFMIHEIRDEANLFVACGDAPEEPGRDLFLRRLGTSVTIGLVTLFALVYMLHGRVQEKLETVVDEPGELLRFLTGGLIVACIAGGWATWSCVRRHGIVVRAYAPLLCIYAVIAGILVAGSLLGSVGFNLIVLIHVTAWFVFVRRRLADRPTPARNWRAWLRTTPAGFITLHVAAVAVVLILMALRVHLWERVGFISQLFATSSFHYWTIMHITMAFWRK